MDRGFRCLEGMLVPDSVEFHLSPGLLGRRKVERSPPAPVCSREERAAEDPETHAPLLAYDKARYPFSRLSSCASSAAGGLECLLIDQDRTRGLDNGSGCTLLGGLSGVVSEQTVG